MINVDAFTPMSYENILTNNLFKDCTIEELQVLWDNLRAFYNCGFITDDSPLKPYKDKYINSYLHNGVRIIQMEKDLLTAIACKTMKEGTL